MRDRADGDRRRDDDEEDDIAKEEGGLEDTLASAANS